MQTEIWEGLGPILQHSEIQVRTCLLLNSCPTDCMLPHVITALTPCRFAGLCPCYTDQRQRGPTRPYSGASLASARMSW